MAGGLKIAVAIKKIKESHAFDYERLGIDCSAIEVKATILIHILLVQQAVSTREVNIHILPISWR